MDSRRTEHIANYRDPTTGLVVRGVAIEYADFPAVEWVVHFGNTGAADTPILSDIQPLDVLLPGGRGSALSGPSRPRRAHAAR